MAGPRVPGCEGLGVGSVCSTTERRSLGNRQDGAPWRENRAFVRCHDTGARAQVSLSHEDPRPCTGEWGHQHSARQVMVRALGFSSRSKDMVKPLS